MDSHTVFDRGTILFDVDNDRTSKIDSIMQQVKDALLEKGYNPVNQIVGYIMSGDPTYITSHNDARNLIQKLERDEIIEEFVKRYLNTLEA